MLISRRPVPDHASFSFVVHDSGIPLDHAVFESSFNQLGKDASLVAIFVLNNFILKYTGNSVDNSHLVFVKSFLELNLVLGQDPHAAESEVSVLAVSELHLFHLEQLVEGRHSVDFVD